MAELQDGDVKRRKSKTTDVLKKERSRRSRRTLTAATNSLLNGEDGDDTSVTSHESSTSSPRKARKKRSTKSGGGDDKNDDDQSTASSRSSRNKKKDKHSSSSGAYADEAPSTPRKSRSSESSKSKTDRKRRNGSKKGSAESGTDADSKKGSAAAGADTGSGTRSKKGNSKTLGNESSETKYSSEKKSSSKKKKKKKGASSKKNLKPSEEELLKSEMDELESILRSSASQSGGSPDSKAASQDTEEPRAISPSKSDEDILKYRNVLRQALEADEKSRSGDDMNDDDSYYVDLLTRHPALRGIAQKLQEVAVESSTEDEEEEEDTTTSSFTHSSILDITDSTFTESYEEAKIVEVSIPTQNPAPTTDLLSLSTEELQAELKRRMKSAHVDAEGVDDIMAPFEKDRWKNADKGSESDPEISRSSKSKDKKDRKHSSSEGSESLRSSRSSSRASSSSSKTNSSSKRTSSSSKDKKKSRKRSSKTEKKDDKHQHDEEQSSDEESEEEDINILDAQPQSQSGSQWTTSFLSSRHYGGASAPAPQQIKQASLSHIDIQEQQKPPRDVWDELALVPPSYGNDVDEVEEVEEEAKEEPPNAAKSEQTTSRDLHGSLQSNKQDSLSFLSSWMGASFSNRSNHKAPTGSDYMGNNNGHVSFMSGSSKRDLMARQRENSAAAVIKPSSKDNSETTSTNGSDTSSASAPDTKRGWFGSMLSQRSLRFSQVDEKDDEEAKKRQEASDSRGREEAARILATAPAASYSLTDRQYSTRKEARLETLRNERARRKAEEEAIRLKRVKKWEKKCNTLKEEEKQEEEKGEEKQEEQEEPVATPTE